MGIISSLFVKISADTAELNKGFAKSQKRAKSWSDEVAGYGKIAAGAFAAVGAAGALAGQQIWASQAPVIDRLGKLSDQLEISVANLESYRYAADQAGVSNDALDQSLLKMNRRIGKAAIGTGAAVKGLQLLNLNARELAGQSTDEAFKTILGRLQEIEDRSVANGIAFDIFGQKASDVMLLTVDALNKGKQELGDFGALLTRVDARQVEAANDAMYRVGVATDAVSQNLAVNMAPLLQASAELFLENAKQSGGFRDVALDGVNAVAKGVGWMGDQIQNVEKGFTLLGYAATSAGLTVVELLNSVGVTSDETVDQWKGYFTDALQDLASVAGERNFSDVLNEKIDSVRERAAAAGEEVRKIGKGGVLDYDEISGKGTKAEGSEKSKESELLDEQIQRAEEYRANLISGYAEIEDSFRVHYDNRYAILNESLERGLITQESYERQYANVRVENEQKSANTIKGIRSGLNSAVIGMLTTLGEKQTIFAKLAVALEAKRAIAETMQKTGVAAIQAYSSVLIPGVPASYAAAAGAYTKTMALGKATAAFIGLNAALEIGGAGGSGASAGGGSSASSDDAGAYSATAPASATTSSETTNNNSNIYVIPVGGSQATTIDLDSYREQLRELNDIGAIKVTGDDIDNMKLEVV